MLIGGMETVMNNKLSVDKWSIEHKRDDELNIDILEENYDGKVNIENVQNQKYLGFILSSRGNNMENNNEMKKKSIGIQEDFQ